MEIVPKKGLIVDFSMEDQRALFKRKEKIERWRKIAKDKKNEMENEGDDLGEKDYEDEKPNPIRNTNEPLDLGAVFA